MDFTGHETVLIPRFQRCFRILIPVPRAFALGYPEAAPSALHSKLRIPAPIPTLRPLPAA
jgi:hypothetical protein